MTKKYIISEIALTDLLLRKEFLEALENGGVRGWMLFDRAIEESDYNNFDAKDALRDFQQYEEE